MLKFTWLTDLKGVEAIATDWDNLLDRSICNRVFSSSGWFLNRCQVFQLQPQVAVAYFENKLVAVVPLIKTKGKAMPFQFEFGDTFLADYQDIIVKRGELESAKEILNFVLDKKNEKVEFFFSNFLKDSNLSSVISEIDLEPFSHHLEAIGRCPYIQIPESWEKYLLSKSANSRKSLRRIERKMEESGLRFRTLGSEDFKKVPFVTVLLNLHQKRMEAKKIKSDLDDPLVQKFLHQALPQLLSKQRIGVSLLEEGDEVAGIMLEVYGDQSIGTWQSGFLEKFEELSPIKYLDIRRIQFCCKEGIQIYDFLRGLEEYKSHWMTDLRILYSLRLARES